VAETCNGLIAKGDSASDAHGLARLPLIVSHFRAPWLRMADLDLAREVVR
jgi:hypothetical protein